MPCKLLVGRLAMRSDVPGLLLPRGNKQPEGQINNAFSANTSCHLHSRFRPTEHLFTPPNKTSSTPDHTMASSNPSNFANLPKDKLSEIAAKGGHASHGGGGAHQDVRINLSLTWLKVPIADITTVQHRHQHQWRCRPQPRRHLYQGL
jgi:hypothetical protein